MFTSRRTIQRSRPKNCLPRPKGRKVFLLVLFIAMSLLAYFLLARSFGNTVTPEDQSKIIHSMNVEPQEKESSALLSATTASTDIPTTETTADDNVTPEDQREIASSSTQAPPSSPSEQSIGTSVDTALSTSISTFGSSNEVSVTDNQRDISPSFNETPSNYSLHSSSIPPSTPLQNSTSISTSNSNRKRGVKHVTPFPSMSFHLWSNEADSINWTSSVEMCDSILEFNSTPNNIKNTDFDRALQWTIPETHTYGSVFDLLSDCKEFLELVPFAKEPGSKEEADYPLAYVIVGARNAAQTVRLLRMIYQPQNAYCITYDKKSISTYQRMIQRLVECIPGKNVFLSPQNEVITWGRMSILRSEMNCLKVLLEKWNRTRWKYVQLQSWNDFPLRTNAELVKIFKIFDGSQDSELSPRLTQEFFASRTRLVPPDGLTMYKGSHASTMTKEFVQFVFTNPTAVKFYKWIEPVKCPEEYYFPTLIHNVHLNAPGSFPGQCQYFYSDRGSQKPWVSRYQVWGWEKGKCKGKHVSFSCVFGVLDIITLINQPYFVAHKVYEEFQPATAFCLEHWFWKKYGKSESNALNTSYYESFPSVRYEKTRKKGSDFEC